MPSLTSLRVLLTAATVLASSPARAADAVGVELEPKVLAGQGKPSLILRAHQTVYNVTLRLRDSRERLFERGVKRVQAGASHRFALPVLVPGRERFVGTLEVHLRGQPPGQIPLDFEVEVVAPLELSLDPADVSVKNRRLRVRSSRPLSVIEVEVTTMEGKTWGPFLTEAVEADGTYEARWEGPNQEILRIAVRGLDADQYFGGIEAYPWKVDVPHSDVEFSTGKSDIRSEEVPKLEESLKALQSAIDKYGRWVKGVRLFVVGHTDSVGSKEHNQRLSEHRARAIARWFKAHGVEVAMAYAGCGERLLLVATPDETDEAKNRRVQYIVAVETPHFEIPVRWKPI